MGIIMIYKPTIQWLGGSWGARGIHTPYIIPTQWGASWSYLEFPNHLIVKKENDDDPRALGIWSTTIFSTRRLALTSKNSDLLDGYEWIELPYTAII